MSNTINQKKSIKASKLAAIFTLFGFLIVIASISYSTFKLATLNKKLGAKKEEIHNKKEELDGLQKKIDQLNQTIDILKYAPISSLITPKAFAVPITGLRDAENRQIYDFTLWIDLPYSRRQEIQSVEYKFEHSTYFDKLKTGREPSNGFSVSYRGWGCLNVVGLTALLENGDKVQTSFDMCKALGW